MVGRTIYSVTTAPAESPADWHPPEIARDGVPILRLFRSGSNYDLLSRDEVNALAHRIVALLNHAEGLPK